MNAKTIKNELYYLGSFYKWGLLSGLVVLLFVMYSAAAVSGKKETVLSVMLVDCHADTGAEVMEADFLEYLGLDKKKQEAEILTSLLFENSDSGSYTMTSLSRFLTEIGNAKLDVCAMLEEDFLKYDKSQTWLDLRNAVTEDLLFSVDTLKTEDGRVIGIYTDCLPVFGSYGCYDNPENRGVIGIIYNAPHPEAAAEYFCYLSGI